jgi:hypothetical protein
MSPSEDRETPRWAEPPVRRRSASFRGFRPEGRRAAGLSESVPLDAFVGSEGMRIVLAALCVGLVACAKEPTTRGDVGPEPSCASGVASFCRGQTFVECTGLGAQTSCLALGRACDPDRGCTACSARSRGCDDQGRLATCSDDGSAWIADGECDAAAGLGCLDGQCVDLCAQARLDRSYEGCEAYAVDLDNAVEGALDASAQQFAVAVSNPSSLPATVTIEVDDGDIGGESRVRVLASRTVEPLGLETFLLPRREVDGSSEAGRNDGTHTSLGRRAYRVRSSVPVVAYQFNPLQNTGLFSADASLLLPTSALGVRTTVNGWPQTLGPGPIDDGTAQFRATLTIVGTEDDTSVTVRLGPRATLVVGAGPIPDGSPGEEITVELDRFDVLNLETGRRGADFTGSTVSSSRPVAVFSGSEAADVPFLEDESLRAPAADHLEEQLPPDASGGSFFVVARQPARTAALIASLSSPPTFDLVDEPDWIRVLNIDEQPVVVETSLPAPRDRITLAPGAWETLEIDRDLALRSDGTISVLQFVSGQSLTGIPESLPGGDPASLVVAPVEQMRQRYVFLTPDRFAFDFVTVVAEVGTVIVLDGKTPEELGCTVSAIPAGGLALAAEYLALRCQLSYPEVALDGTLEPGLQGDGVHRIDADAPVGVSVYGFDRFISYAYPAGLDLDILR